MSYSSFLATRLSGVANRGQSVSGVTGTMAAGLAQGGAVWVLRYPAAATGKLFVGRIHQHITAIAAFTTAVTAGRRLELVRGSGADASGGAALDVARKHSAEAVETLCTGRIATTAALTTSGITFESAPLRRLTLSHAGSAGADYDEEWRFDGQATDPLILTPGQLIAGLAGAAFDAGGTWQLNLSIDAVELS